MQRRCNMFGLGVLLGVFLMVTLAVSSVQANDVFSGTGNWSDGSKWSGGVPGPGDDVEIAAGANCTIDLSAGNIAVNSYTLDATANQTFLGTNALVVANVAAINGAATHPTNSATAPVGGVWYPDNLIYIKAGSLTISSSGQINVDGMGYTGSILGVAPNGYGPGGSIGSPHNDNFGAGAGYGGAGGNGYAMAFQGGPEYGVANAPVDPGSGGGIGGNGGGAVHLVVTGQVEIDGTISANGIDAAVAYPPAGSYRNGGSGGGVYIECATFQGSGVVQVCGGNGGIQYGTGGGGGGRIAVVYTDSATQAGLPKPSIMFNAKGGDGSSNSQYPSMNFTGVHGTLYFPDASALPQYLTGYYRLMLGSVTSWSPNNLTVNTGLVWFATDGFTLTVANQVLLNNGGGILLTNHAALNCQSLTVTNGSSLWMISGVTNGATWTTYGSLISVAGDMVIASSSTNFLISHPTNGGSVSIAANNLIVGAGGMINADAAGYGSDGSGNTYGPGRGGGAGVSAGSDCRSGGGYGGGGGQDYDYQPGGAVYGSASAPLDPGSPGHSPLSTTYPAGAGGGLVQVYAQGQIRLDGTISANGGNCPIYSVGGGSGGGVYLHCSTFAGTGLIRADGAYGSPNYDAGGGGGRIAVIYNPANEAGLSPKPSVAFSAQGAGGNDNSGGWLYGDIAPLRSGIGSLYLPDASIFPTAFVSGSYVDLMTPVSSLSLASLTVSNAYLQLPPSLSLTVSGGLCVDQQGTLALTNQSTLTCDSVSLVNGGTLSIYSGPTNAAPWATYGALVNVTHSLSIGNGSTNCLYSDPVNGGSVLLKVGSLNVASGGILDALGKGYAGASASARGNGPGASPSANYAYNGAGYGGMGGASGDGGSMWDYGGPTYGDPTAPIDPGSGGNGNGAGLIFDGGNGGGSVHIQASGTVQIDGIVDADGTFVGKYSGGGSGGGIYISCATLAGAGSISARGSQGEAASYSGCGGGGRIAIWTHGLSFSGDLSTNTAVAGGAFPGGGWGPASAGTNGTVQLFKTAIHSGGTVFMLR